LTGNQGGRCLAIAPQGTRPHRCGAYIVSSGNIDTGDIIKTGGEQEVYGSAIATGVAGGSLQFIESGGMASGAIINGAGSEVVQSGGIDSAVAISGGTFEVASGGSTGIGPVTFRPAICRRVRSIWAQPSRLACRIGRSASVGRRMATWHRQAIHPY
jgi:autotransporter passenger strand-loop-strand repeat protein